MLQDKKTWTRPVVISRDALSQITRGDVYKIPVSQKDVPE